MQLYVLGAFLVPDIPADDLCRDGISDGPHTIAVLPELPSPELATQSWATRKEFAGGDAFEELAYPGGCGPWRCGEKQMDMVFPHLHRVNLHSLCFRNLGKEVLDGLCALSNEHSRAVCRCPDNGILQVINGMGACFVGHTEMVAALRAARFPPHSKLWGTQRDFSWERRDASAKGYRNVFFRPVITW